LAAAAGERECGETAGVDAEKGVAVWENPKGTVFQAESRSVSLWRVGLLFDVAYVSLEWALKRV
jgi:hypothetical protein